MPTRSGRARVWMPWSSGASVLSLAAGVTTRFLIPSIVEGATVLDRKVQAYTTVRTLLSFQGFTASANMVITLGIILAARDITATLLSPVGDPSAAWLWHEEFMCTPDKGVLVTRDVLGKRKSAGLGLQNELFAYIENRGSATLSFHYSGRTLVLLG